MGQEEHTIPSIISQRCFNKTTKQTYFKTFFKGKLLGKGGFAYCYEITNTDSDKKYACKAIPKSKLIKKNSKLKLMAEIKIHKFVCNHKNIVKFDSWFEDKHNVFIILELCNNKSLLDFLHKRKRLSESEVQYFMIQLISAVQYLHSKYVIHRDLKLGNIFLCSNFDIKLGDFGLAAKLENINERKMTLCGTPNYIAPEILARDKIGHSFEVDVWSIGVIMYTLLVGVPPFETSNIKHTCSRIKHNFYNFPSNVKISSVSKDLIKRILNNDPKKRPSLKEIRADSFFMNYKPSKIAFLNNISKSPKKKNLINKIGKKKPLSIITNKLKRNKIIKCKEENIGNVMLPEKRTRRLKDRRKDISEKEIIKVLCYVDYSSKYGVGYILSNGCAGVYFNDATKIIYNRKNGKVKYIDRIYKFHSKTSSSCSTSDSYTEKSLSMSISNYPSTVSKKMYLLKHFTKYLDNKIGNENKFINKNVEEMIYVHRWHKTSHSKIFVLSNKTIQIIFNDESEISVIINDEMNKNTMKNNHVTYKKSQCEKVNQYTFECALNSKENDLKKRMKYVNEIIKKLAKLVKKEL